METKNVQLNSFANCCKMSWNAMLRILPPTTQTCLATKSGCCQLDLVQEKRQPDFVARLQNGFEHGW